MRRNMLLIALVLVILLSACNNEMVYESITETQAWEKEEEMTMPTEDTMAITYYEDNETINAYLNNYNLANAGYTIEKDGFTKYSHHGAIHDDQIVIYEDGFKIVISDLYYLEVYMSGNRETTNDDYKVQFFRFAKGYNSELADAVLENYWQQLLEDLTNCVKFEEFECDLTIYDGKIESLLLKGSLG